MAEMAGRVSGILWSSLEVGIVARATGARSGAEAVESISFRGSGCFATGRFPAAGAGPDSGAVASLRFRNDGAGQGTSGDAGASTAGGELPSAAAGCEGATD